MKINIKVFGIPIDTDDLDLKNLEGIVCGVASELKITQEIDIYFIPDMRIKIQTEKILVEVTGLSVEYKEKLNQEGKFAEMLGKMFKKEFPKSAVACRIIPSDFRFGWSSRRKLKKKD